MRIDCRLATGIANLKSLHHKRLQPCRYGNKQATLAMVDSTQGPEMTEQNLPLDSNDVPAAGPDSFPASLSSGIAISRRICAMLCALLFLAINTERADAGCICQCVDGQMQPLCQSSIDVAPVCPAAVCPSRARRSRRSTCDHSTDRHVAMSSGTRVRHVRKLPVATGLPIASRKANLPVAIIGVVIPCRDLAVRSWRPASAVGLLAVGVMLLRGLGTVGWVPPIAALRIDLS